MPSRKIAEYNLNGEAYITIERINKQGERVWVKNVPKSNTRQVTILNILDKPEDVTWRTKSSHFEEILPNGAKTNYKPAMEAGSMLCMSGTHIFTKDVSSSITLFPLDPLYSAHPVKEFIAVGNSSQASTFSITLDAPTWVAQGSTSGTITPRIVQHI